MIFTEFNDWLAYHVRAFPAVGDWIKKHPDTVEFWANPFEDVNLADAKAATDAMAAGKIEDPRGYSKHPIVIARYARELHRANARPVIGPNGERTFSCAVCCDDGMVAVVDPIHYRKGRLRSCSVYCTCPVGDRKQNRSNADGHRSVVRPRFDPGRMFPWNGELTVAQNQVEFEAWLNSDHGIASHRNFTDFGEYSGDQSSEF